MSTVITLESDNHTGSGEAAPLPGFSADSLADCESALRAVDLRQVPEQLEVGESAVESLARASREVPAELPAARAALEAALLELWAQRSGLPAWALLTRGAAPAPRRLVALISREPRYWLDDALAARERGLSACKLKVGRAGVAQTENEALHELRAALGPSFDLRLDANQAWSPMEARQLLAQFSGAAPELIEEPCALAGLTNFAPFASPLGLDESLNRLPPEARVLAPLMNAGVRALVLKPTLLGGISACARWVDLARELGLAVILSHLFEGPLGLALSATLALVWGSPERAQGLDLEGAGVSSLTLPYFASGALVPWQTPGFGMFGARE